LAVNKLFHTMGVVSLLALCVAVPLTAGAQTTPQQPDNTFSGALAPAHPRSETNKPPEGYRGVMPGHTAPAPQQPVEASPQDDNGNGKPTKRMPRTATKLKQDQQDQPGHHKQRAMSEPDRGMSVRPGFEKHKTLTAEDLKQIAAMTGIEVRLDQLPDNMQNAVHMPAHVYPLVSLPQPRVDGMLPLEFGAKQMIDKEMQDVDNAAKISPEARQKAVGDAITTLANFAHSARVKRDMPSEIYLTMGVPQTYIDESKEGSGKAAERLEAAIRTLQQQQQ
jgi:hypothetical protein